MPGAPGLASFRLEFDGVAQQPFECPQSPWDYPLPHELKAHVVLVNTGTAPLAYNAEPVWSVAQPAFPGVGVDCPDLVGVLAPGATVDISAVYTAGTPPPNGASREGGGMIATLGSSLPFSSGPVKPLSDEGIIAWPSGVPGSGDSAIMYVVQLTDSAQCIAFAQFW